MADVTHLTREELREAGERKHRVNGVKIFFLRLTTSWRLATLIHSWKRVTEISENCFSFWIEESTSYYTTWEKNCCYKNKSHFPGTKKDELLPYFVENIRKKGDDGVPEAGRNRYEGIRNEILRREVWLNEEIRRIPTKIIHRMGWLPDLDRETPGPYSGSNRGATWVLCQLKLILKY